MDFKKTTEWKSIKYSNENKNRISKDFVNHFEKREKLEKNKEWLKIKKELRFI